MKDQIRVLLSQVLSIRKVALALGISRQSVRKFGTDQPTVVGAPGVTSAPAWDAAINWEDAAKQFAAGATIKQLRSELAPEASYTRFRRRLIAMAPRSLVATMRLEQKPGEQMQIDYCDGIGIVDRVTGEVRKTHLFCAVLPFSSYTFGEFAMSQNLASFIESHKRMWASFGGVAPYVVIDNLKAGVRAAHRYDPDVNPRYCE